MISPLAFNNNALQPLKCDDLSIIDVSDAPKFGVKGKGASEFLQANNYPIPEKYNSAIYHGDILIARLGVNEFLLEGEGVDALYGKPASPQSYQVLRQDCCLLLRGEAIYKILSQSCAIDFASADPKDLSLFLTSMVGVSVTILLSEEEGKPQVRIYCDPTYGAYLFKTLLEIGGDL